MKLRFFTLCSVAILGFLLFAASSCDKKDNPRQRTISPPIIDPPLLECASAVTVKGFIPGATIDIYANGSTRIGGGVSDAPWGQSFAVAPELVAGDQITARQTFDGKVSGPSIPVTVVNPEKFYGGSLPKPEVNKPIYNCGGAISVTKVAKGGLLQVYADGATVGSVNGSGEGQWLYVSPVFSEGQKVTADAKLCAMVSPKADEVEVDAEPSLPLPVLIVGDMYEGGKYVNVYNIMNGAKVKTFNGSTIVDESYYSGGGQVVRLTPQPAAGDVLTATQEFCKGPSDPSDPSVVQPCSALPAPNLGPICPGDVKVTIVGAQPDARIKVYRDGVLAADGGGPELMLLVPAKAGETYAVTQSLGTCVSPISIAIAVGCGKPEEMKPNIPYAGRAVAVAVDPLDDDIMVVASESGGMFRSINRGMNWTRVTGPAPFAFTDVTFLDYAPNIAIATARDDSHVDGAGGIYRSNDRGVTWKRVTLTTPIANCFKTITGFSVSVDTVGNIVWAGTSCGLAFSKDAGLTWNWQPTVANFTNTESVTNVETPDDKRIVIQVGGWAVRVSNDAGASFKVAEAGMPGRRYVSDHPGQIAISQRNLDHIYRTMWWTPHRDSADYRQLWVSTDFGSTWTSVLKEKADPNRIVWIRTALPIKGGTDFDLYWSDGTGIRRGKGSATNGTVSSWKTLTTDHADIADIGFANDHSTPLLLCSDGGLHTTQDKGDSWKLTGGGPAGYNALQVTEVTGQLAGEDGKADLYFGTQDNSLWASPDEGASWPKEICCEGFFLNIMRESLPPDQSRFTGVLCGACVNFTTQPVFASKTNWSNPARNQGNPRLLKPKNYIQNTIAFDSIGSLYALSKNDGSSWDSSFKFLQETRDLPKVAGSTAAPIVFAGFKDAGTTPEGYDVVHIKQVTGTLSAGGPVLSDISNFGSLGLFATMFAWYYPFGVDPNNTRYMMAPDVNSDSVKFTTNGGLSWQSDKKLTALVKGNGIFDFENAGNVNVTTIGINPDCRGNIFVGTRDNGVFVTYNRGATWGRIPGSELIPNVSSFFFNGSNEVFISSYGRGLWRYKFECLPYKETRQKSPKQIAGPYLYHFRSLIPLSSIKEPQMMGDVIYLLVRGGDIADYSVNPETGEILEIVLTAGQVEAFEWNGKATKLPVKVRVGSSKSVVGGDKELALLLREENLRVKGLALVRNVLKAPIVHDKDVTPSDLPKPAPQVPYLFVMNRARGGSGVGQGESVKVKGIHFVHEAPLEFLLDGIVVKEDIKPFWDKETASFTASVPAMLSLGMHKLTVRQRADGRTIEESVNFAVVINGDMQKR